MERLTRRYTAFLIDILGPDRDVPAPDVNTDERVMAWIMDTYSMHMRHTVTGVVTGKPIDLGGSWDELKPRAAAARLSRPGGFAIWDESGIDPGHCSGLWKCGLHGGAHPV